MVRRAKKAGPIGPCFDMYQTADFYCICRGFHVENIVRYWIWCNDLTQGPFEPDELASLRAFSEDLLVCLEGREEWVPAGRVADLSASLEQQKRFRAQPVAPPPPPPSRPPGITPLQGEFFGEPPGQQTLLPSDDAPKGPFAFRPVTADAEIPSVYFSGQATMPFHFSQRSNAAAAIALPRPAPQKTRFFPRREVVTESPVPKEELPEPVSLQILHEETIEKPVVISPAESPSQAPALDEPFEQRKRLEWLPWIMGVALALVTLVSTGYWLMDRASTHSAITEANRLEPPVPMSLPATTPLPAPKVDVRDRTIPAAVSPAKAPARKTSLMPVVRKKARVAVTTLKKAIASIRRGVPVLLARFEAVAKRQAPAPIAVAPVVPVAPPAHVVPVKATQKKPVTHRTAHPHPAPHSLPHVKANLPHPMPKPEPEVKPAAMIKPTVVHLPGIPEPLPAAIVPAPIAVSPEIPPVDVPAPAAPRPSDPWAGRQSDAIRLVMARTLPGSKITVGAQAKTMLKQMHEKELMHAAETGERLYLPDKMAWAALQEEGVRYRVYLNFQAMQANGERLQTRSYQFIVDLKSKAVRADDPATEQDLLTQNAELNFKHNPMATDIDSILGGVDAYNKHKVQMIIIKKNRSNRDERKKIETALKTAQDKVQRAIIYFRRTYADKALQNVARAYDFVELANGK